MGLAGPVYTPEQMFGISRSHDPFNNFLIRTNFFFSQCKKYYFCFPSNKICFYLKFYSKQNNFRFFFCPQSVHEIKIRIHESKKKINRVAEWPTPLEYLLINN